MRITYTVLSRAIYIIIIIIIIINIKPNYQCSPKLYILSLRLNSLWSMANS